MSDFKREAVAWQYVRAIPGSTGGYYYDTQFSQARWTADYLIAHGATETPLIPATTLDAMQRRLEAAEVACGEASDAIANLLWNFTLNDYYAASMNEAMNKLDNARAVLRGDGKGEGTNEVVK